MRTEIRFHEGLKGSGVVVSVTYNQSRLVFDFGAPFKPDTNIYDGMVMRRNESRLIDALRLGETPLIDGIYPRKNITMWNGNLYNDLQPFEESTLNTMVLISHLHLDHMSNIDYLDESIPVIMHKNSKLLLNALSDIHEGVTHTNIVPVEYEEEIRYGEITITPYFSDHPCYGSTSYFIETPDMKILYSGDIRFHGVSRERAFKEIERLGEKEIDLLIVDGTSYSPSKFIHNPEKIEELARPSKDILEGMFLETGIYEDVANQLNNQDKMGLFCIYHRDMQLIEALIETMNKINREVIFETETAYIINKVLNKSVSFYHPDMELDEEILDYVRKNNKELSFKDINENKSKYLVQVTYKNILNLHSLECNGGVFFHLFGDPFGKDNKSVRILKTMLENNGIDYVGYSNVYSFNHAFPNHLSWMIGTLAPKNVVCVHSNNPEKLNAMGSNHILPEQHVPYIYENEQLKML